MVDFCVEIINYKYNKQFCNVFVLRPHVTYKGAKVGPRENLVSPIGASIAPY